MDVQLEKYKIIEWITSLKDVTVIKRLKSLKEEASQDDWWDKLSKEEIRGIQRGLKDIEEGNLIPHDEAIKELKKRSGF